MDDCSRNLASPVTGRIPRAGPTLRRHLRPRNVRVCYLYSTEQELARFFFSVKRHILNISISASCVVFVVTTQLCRLSTKVTVDNMQLSKHDGAPVTLCLQEKV